MRPDDRDAAFLWDMREAAADVLEFTRERVPKLLERIDPQITPEPAEEE